MSLKLKHEPMYGLRMIRRASLAVVIAVLVGWSARPASAGMLIFMRIDGIAGDSKDPRHQGWFDVQAVSGGVEQMLPTRPPPVEPVVPKPKFSEISVLKFVDSGSPELLSRAGFAIPLDEVEIEFVTPGVATAFFRITLRSAYMAAVKHNGSADGPASVPTELVTFKFIDITWTHSKLDASGKVLSSTTKFWSNAKAGTW